MDSAPCVLFEFAAPRIGAWAQRYARRQRPVHELRIAGLPVLVIDRAGHSSIGGTGGES